MESDLGLIKRVIEGDKDAFEELIVLYEKKVYNICFRMSGNREDALDLSQEVFIKVYRSVKSFKADSMFSTWLYRVTMNVCVDYSRKTRSQARQISLYSQEGKGGIPIDIPDERFNPEEYAEKEDRARMVWNAINMLSPEHKRILILREISGKSYVEIADILEMEEGTVKSRISRARENMRRILSDSGNFIDR